MKRFVLQQNVARFRGLLRGNVDGDLRHTIAMMLAAAERELATLNATLNGAAPYRPQGIARSGMGALAPNDVARELEGSSTPMVLIHPGPGLQILDLNQAYAEATLIDMHRAPGERMFDVFPDNPDDPLADGVQKLFASLTTAAETGRPHKMAVLRYDVRDRSGKFVERYWQPVNTPLFGADGQMTAILHSASDVTWEVLAMRRMNVGSLGPDPVRSGVAS